VPLLKATLASPAWRAMSHGARNLYVALKLRYSSNLKNNGRIYVSTRDAAEELGSNRTYVSRWFRELHHYGFIVMTSPGCLGVDGNGMAPHWRLTEVGYMHDAPTRDFLKWDGTAFKDTVHPRRKGTSPGSHCHNSYQQNPGPQTGATLDHKLVPGVDHKLVPPNGTSGPQTGAIYGGRGGPQTGAITSLPLPSAEKDPWQDLDIPAYLRRERV
jgi:hypothetical protein